MLLSITMLFLGLLLGFIGAGGSGFIIAILVTVFHIPIHEALGTAVPVMFINVITGSMSHFREGNIYVKQGLLVGLFGGIGAYFGMRLTTLINPNVLMLFTVFALASSGVLIWLKTRMKLQKEEVKKEPVFLSYVGIGLGNGLISGTFGIGAAPFIQLSLLKWLHFPMRIAAGTTMLVLLPVAFLRPLGPFKMDTLILCCFFK